MGLVAVVLIAFTGYHGGTHLILQGLEHSGASLLMVLPLLLLAFGISGLLQGLLRKETIQGLLGREAGFRGILLGGLAGAIMPGGPYVFYPVALGFLRGGADMGSLIAFVAAKNLWTVSRIPVEVALVGWQIFVSRFVVTLCFPLIAGFLANLLFPHAAEDVRNWLDQREEPGKGGSGL